MELKHPNDQAVAQRLQNFEEGLRKGWYSVGAVEQVIAHIKQLDDEAEARWRAILKQEAEAKQRAEKESWFMRKCWGKPGEVFWGETRIAVRPAKTSYHLKEERLVAAKDRLIEALRILQEVTASGETSPGAMLNLTMAVRSILKAKTNISWGLDDV